MHFTREAFFLWSIFISGGLALAKVSIRGIRIGKMALLKSRIKRAQQLIKKLYEDEENPYLISLNYRQEKHIDGDEYTYGEIVVPAFAELMRRVHPQPGEIFYDLGCGAGKAVFAAALCFPFLQVKGVELLPPIYALAVATQKRFNELVIEDAFFRKEVFNIEFIRGNLLKKDFSQGNIFFMNATCFKYKDWQGLQKKLGTLPVGTRLVVVTRELESDAFELIDGATYQMSWGPCAVYVYRKIS